MINRLAINTVGDELEAAADFCRAQGIGLEVADFAFPAKLDIDMTSQSSYRPIPGHATRLLR